MSIDLDILAVPAAAQSQGGSASKQGSAGDQASVDNTGRTFDDHLSNTGNAHKTKSAATSKPTANGSKTTDNTDHTQSTASENNETSDGKTLGSTETRKPAKTDSSTTDSKEAKSDTPAADVAQGDVSNLVTKSDVAIAATTAAHTDDTTSRNEKSGGVSDAVLSAVQDMQDAKDAETPHENNGLQLGVTKADGASSDSKPTESNAQSTAPGQTASNAAPKAGPALKTNGNGGAVATNAEEPSSQTPVQASTADAPRNGTKPSETELSIATGKNADTTPAAPKTAAPDTNAATAQPAPDKSDAAKAASTLSDGNGKSGDGQLTDGKSRGQAQTTTTISQASADSTKPQNTGSQVDTALPAKSDPAGGGQSTAQSSLGLTLPDQAAAQAQAQTAQVAASTHAKMLMNAYGAAPGIDQQVAVQITKAALDGLNRFSIQLHPADLGRVDVRLDMSHDGHVTAMVTADRHDTLNLLQRDARSLERSLQDMGLKMDAGGMQFSLKDQGDSSGQAAELGHAGSGRDLAGSEPDLGQTVIAAAATTSMNNRMLDIRV